ncbi:2-hydroxyacid dehydrogenase [Agarivorans sp. B2Z047]|uniref:D-lactate dehydrogenase n=1 Tax=Agarivorans albus MKT 106 TaxID=1331007 RepID=R9PL81_AGAAL|nr:MULTISPECIES: 2-hydroxyacid dehydrogenase [Agarivorans]MPW28868.1 2-hydroxyacid dehydrogenase [Agarivorans sp. B2Z047]UQN41427.1 2-hydroxyacid dehydrogenase [Agarivorans sp. B2Z047]GAD02023.1 D-lactate dehydrogenase [Agarivorans albus MKT 106]
MKISFFSAKRYDREHFDAQNTSSAFSIEYFDTALSAKTARLAHGADAVCAFVNDDLSAATLEALAEHGIQLILLRCAGFNNVDLAKAEQLGITVSRVPAYSPEAVAEHAIALMMTLNRRIHKAYQRTRDANFSLEGLTGMNIFGKTAGVIGTGKIGLATARILKGFGCRVIAFDPYPNDAAKELGIEYVSMAELLAQSNIITLHCPLTPENTYLIGKSAFSQMKKGTLLINTSRGKLVDSTACIEALKDGTLGGLALDVYEHEKELFFEDLSAEVILDDVFRRLSACHNVIFTGHQAFLTQEALQSIADTTLLNANAFSQGQRNGNEVTAEVVDNS